MKIKSALISVSDKNNINSILKILAEKYNGGPVGIETISASLSEQKDVVEEVIEPYLIQENFVDRTQRGRILTSEGWNYLGLPIPKNSFVYEDSKNSNNWKMNFLDGEITLLQLQKY